MDCDSWELVRKWIETGSLIAVAVLAVFQEWIKKRWNKTKLKLDIKTIIPSKTAWNGDSNKPVYFLLVEVKNINEKRPAVKTRVLLTEIYKKNNNDKYDKYRLDSPLQMKSSPAELHNRDPFPTIVKPRVIDLGHVSRGDEKGFAPGVVIFPYNFEGFLAPVESTPHTHYVLYGFEFDCVNCESKKPEYIEVYWNGVWEDAPEKMSKNLYAKKLPESEIDFA